jgi:Arc/MetJ-type ribon-helix-helix transcriptional regulator
MSYDEYETAGIGHNRVVALQELANRQQASEKRVAELEEALDEEKKKLRQISEIEIPNFMDGMNGSTELPDGRKVTISDAVRASLPKDRADEGAKWLAEHNSGSIVKQKFVIEFNKNQEDKAKAFEEFLNSNPKCPVYTRENSVHHSTLTSWARKKLESGEQIPMELFGVHVSKKTKIKDK